MASLSVPFLEVFLADAACRAGPVVRKVFEWGSGSNSVFGVSLCRIINESASDANIFLHIPIPLVFLRSNGNICAIGLHSCLNSILLAGADGTAAGFAESAAIAMYIMSAKVTDICSFL